MNIYIYMYIYIYTHIQVCMHISSYTYMYTYTHTHCCGKHILCLCMYLRAMMNTFILKIHIQGGEDLQHTYSL